MCPRLVLVAVGLATVLVSDVAAAAPAGSAPPPPEGTATRAPATGGSAELSGQGTFGTVAARDEAAGDALEWDLSFGALFGTGNARSTAITGGTNFRLRRSRHQASASFLGNYGRAATGPGTEPVDTVGNLQGRARYDLFVAERWSLFGMVTARHDPFQRLDLRLNVDPGVAFYVINGQKERLFVEAGYDFQYDVRASSAVQYALDGSLVYDAQGNPVPLPRTYITHAARLAGGYANRLDETFGFATDLEYLQSLVEALRWRLNWNTTVSAQLVAKLALAATFTLRFDNDPLPRVKHLDTLSSVNLVYRFF
jgi:putative salt-induced outer membrane protein YdiY